MRSGTKRLGFRQSESSVLVKKITSGSMVQVLAVRVLRFIMTVVRNTAAASLDCTVGCECDRYMEIWNNVFTQFDNDGHGNYTELEQKNIDTGMGLERLACIVQDVDSMFDIDTIKRTASTHVCRMAGV